MNFYMVLKLRSYEFKKYVTKKKTNIFEIDISIKNKNQIKMIDLRL